MPKLNLTRDVLARIAQGNQQAVHAFERIFSDVGTTLPSSIEEANALAGSALAVAQAALAGLAVLADSLARMDGAPATQPQVDPDDTTPRPHLGTVSSQNADSVEITGGTIDGATLGATTAATARVTTLTVTTGLGAFNKGMSVNGPATLGATGTTQWSWETPIMRYFVGDGTGYSLRLTKRVTSANTDLFTFTDGGDLTVLGKFGCNGKAAQSAYALGSAATDLASVITLANNLRTMSINNGIGS